MLRHRLLRVNDGGDPAFDAVHPELDAREVYPSSPFLNDLDRYLWHRATTRRHAIDRPLDSSGT